VFGLVKPALKQAAVDKPAPVGRQLDAVVNDANELPQVAASAQPLALEMARTSDKLEAARAAARDNPVAVANVVRDWVGSGAN
jgi:flagellar M-ring protein FliF